MRWATCANCWRTIAPSSTVWRNVSLKRKSLKVKRSNPSSATAAAPAPWLQDKPQPASGFLFEKRRAWIMGVLNVPPDSFYAGARSPALPDALAHAENLIQEGADLLDIGGESTRPGADEIPLAEELERVL